MGNYDVGCTYYTRGRHDSYTSEQRPDHLTLLLTATRLRGSDVSEVLKYMHTPYSFFPYLNDSSFRCIHSYIRICNHRQC